MLLATLPESPAQIMSRYDCYHGIMRRFQNLVPQTLSRHDLESAARDLGVWIDGTLKLAEEDDIAPFMDYAIYGWLDKKDESAVMRFLRANPQEPDSDEDLVLRAMANSRYAITQITKRIPKVGVECYDLVRRRSYFLANHGLGFSASEGTVLASRLVSVPGFEISTGADMPLDQDAFETLCEMFNAVGSKFRLRLEDFDDPLFSQSLSFMAINVNWAVGTPNLMRRLDNPAEMVSEMAGASRNRPCPCGSGKKFKRCCGELVRH